MAEDDELPLPDVNDLSQRIRAIHDELQRAGLYTTAEALLAEVGQRRGVDAASQVVGSRAEDEMRAAAHTHEEDALSATTTAAESLASPVEHHVPTTTPIAQSIAEELARLTLVPLTTPAELLGDVGASSSSSSACSSAPAFRAALMSLTRSMMDACNNNNTSPYHTSTNTTSEGIASLYIFLCIVLWQQEELAEVVELHHLLVEELVGHAKEDEEEDETPACASTAATTTTTTTSSLSSVVMSVVRLAHAVRVFHTHVGMPRQWGPVVEAGHDASVLHAAMRKCSPIWLSRAEQILQFWLDCSVADKTSTSSSPPLPPLATKRGRQGGAVDGSDQNNNNNCRDDHHPVPPQTAALKSSREELLVRHVARRARLVVWILERMEELTCSPPPRCTAIVAHWAAACVRRLATMDSTRRLLADLRGRFAAVLRHTSAPASPESLSLLFTDSAHNASVVEHGPPRGTVRGSADVAHPHTVVLSLHECLRRVLRARPHRLLRFGSPALQQQLMSMQKTPQHQEHMHDVEVGAEQHDAPLPPPTATTTSAVLGSDSLSSSASAATTPQQPPPPYTRLQPSTSFTTSDPVDERFGDPTDNIRDQVLSITSTKDGALVAMISSHGKLLVYANTAATTQHAHHHQRQQKHKMEVEEEEEELVLCAHLLPWGAHQAQWYELIGSIVEISPDGRYVMAAIQYAAESVAPDNEATAHIPEGTGALRIYSLHQRQPHMVRKGIEKMMRAEVEEDEEEVHDDDDDDDDACYATYTLHRAPIITARWADARFWPREKLAAAHLRRQATVRIIDEDRSPIEHAWRVAARTYLHPFQCFSVGLDDELVRWLPSSGVVLQRIATPPLQDLIISPLRASIYSIDDGGSLGMMDVAWRRSTARQPASPHELEHTATPLVVLGAGGLPLMGLPPSPGDPIAPSDGAPQRQHEADRQVPPFMFAASCVLRWSRRSRSGAVREAEDGEEAREKEEPTQPLRASMMSELARLIRGSGRSSCNAVSGDADVLHESFRPRQAAQVGSRLLRRLFASAVRQWRRARHHPLVELHPSSSSEDDGDGDGVVEQRRYGLRPSSPHMRYSHPRSPVSPKHRRRRHHRHHHHPHHHHEDDGARSWWCASGSRVVIGEVGHALRTLVDAPYRHHLQATDYRLIGLALSGCPSWSDQSSLHHARAAKEQHTVLQHILASYASRVASTQEADGKTWMADLHDALRHLQYPGAPNATPITEAPSLTPTRHATSSSSSSSSAPPTPVLPPTAANGRFLCVMASVGPARVRLRGNDWLSFVPGIYGCVVVDTLFSQVVRVIPVCPVQPSPLLSTGMASHTLDADAPEPIFALQCSLTTVRRPTSSPGPRTSTTTTAGKEEEEMVVLTVGGLHAHVGIFNALTGERLHGLVLPEAKQRKSVLHSTADSIFITSSSSSSRTGSHHNEDEWADGGSNGNQDEPDEVGEGECASPRVWRSCRSEGCSSRSSCVFSSGCDAHNTEISRSIATKHAAAMVEQLFVHVVHLDGAPSLMQLLSSHASAHLPHGEDGSVTSPVHHLDAAGQAMRLSWTDDEDDDDDDEPGAQFQCDVVNGVTSWAGPNGFVLLAATERGGVYKVGGRLVWH